MQGLPAVFHGRSEGVYGYIGACTTQENFVRKKISQFWAHFLSMPVFQLRTFFFWKVNIRSRYEKYPDLGPQIPGF